ncbi:MAG: uroporphyrinogen-III synthase [Aquisalinus sp.]|nr:uroporphyrinogen-III synthase [Aquisalinus sp.]
MKVLVTRPEPDAAVFADMLQANGMSAVFAPMMQLQFPDVATPDLSNIKFLIFTSANGVRAFTRIIAERVWPVFTVGAATARAALAAGFSQIETASGSVQSLARVIAEKADDDACLMHIAGTHIAGDLASLLEARGFQYSRAVLYEAVAVDCIADQTLNCLKEGYIDAATFFSPRTAKIFLSLVSKYDLTEALKNLRIVVVSHAVAAVFLPGFSSQIEVAKEPDQHAVIDILKSART